VHPLVRDLARPFLEMRFQRRPAREAPPGDRVLLDVADAALVLALGPRPVGCAGFRPEPPVPGEGMEARGELDLASRSCRLTSPRSLSSSTSSGTPPKWRKALSRPASQLS